MKKIIEIVFSRDDIEIEEDDLRIEEILRTEKNSFFKK